MNFLWPSSALALMALCVGCGGTPAGGTCTPGTSSPCTCTSGQSGAQVCADNGTYGTCVCEGGGSGGSSSGGAGSGSGGTTSGSGGATAATGGASASGGATSSGGGSGDCPFVQETCQGLAYVDPNLSLKDQMSNRTVDGHFCSDGLGNATWVTEEICPYSSECDFNTIACVPCGDDGRRTGLRMTNGVLTEECEGCGCYFWNVGGCTTDTTEHGEPYAIVNFQIDADVYQIHVTESGQTWSAQDQAGAVVTASNVAFTIAPGALVEFDVTVDYTFTNLFSEQETWHLAGHVVDTCQE